MNAQAQLKAAAWQIVSASGYKAALEALGSITAEIKDAQWNGK